MNAELKFSPEDLDTLAARIVEKLGRFIEKQIKPQGEDIIFDVQGLAEYLSVKDTWVYRKVSDGDIPHFKVGKYPRFRKIAIDRWLKTREVRPVPCLVASKGEGRAA